MSEFSVEHPDTAEKSLENELSSPEKVQALSDFLKKDPDSEIGHVDSLQSEVSGTLNQKTKTAVSTVDSFIDKAVESYEGDSSAKSLLERDLIASYQEKGGMEKIKKVLGMKSLNITKVEVEIYGGQIHVSGANKEGGRYHMVEFPLKSSLRTKAEEKFKQAVATAQAATSEVERNATTPAPEATTKGAKNTPAEAPVTKATEVKNKLEAIEKKTGLKDKAAETVLEGNQRTEKLAEQKEAVKKADIQKVYTKEEMEKIINREVYIDKDIYKKWSGMDVSDPEIFKHITNIESVRNLIAQPPFKWGLGNLHKAIQDGNNQIVELDDLIDEEGLGIKDDNEFMSDYLKMAPAAEQYFGLQLKINNQTQSLENTKKLLAEDEAKSSDDPSKMKPEDRAAAREMIATIEQNIATLKEEVPAAEKEYNKVKDKFEHYNAIIAQGVRILDALDPKNFHLNEVSKEDQTALRFESMMESAKEKAPEGNVKAYYSINSMAAVKPIDQDDHNIKEQKEKQGIGVDSKVFEDWKAKLITSLESTLKVKYAKGEHGSKDRFWRERSKIDRMDEVSLLKIAGDVYGYENLVKSGNITKTPGENPQLVLTSIPEDFDPSKVTDGSKMNALFKSIEWQRAGFNGNDFKYDKPTAQEVGIEHMDDMGKVDAFLNKIFNKNHLGEKIVGGNGQVMDILLADGLHSTVYADHFKTYLTGESAYTNSKEDIIQAAEMEATAKGESREDYSKYAMKKAVELINAYIKLGSLNSEILFKTKKEIAPITEDDIKNQKISQEQIEAAQMGSSIEWSLSEKFQELDQIDKSKNPVLYELVRQVMWNNPGMTPEKKQAFMKAIKQIDLGTLGFYVGTDQHSNVENWGIGYNKSIPIGDTGLAFSVTVAGFSGNGAPGGVGATGVGGSHRVGEKVKINWGITAGVAGNANFVGPFVAANVGADIEVSDAYDFSIGAFVGSDLESLVKAGVTIGAKADVQRSYERQWDEKYKNMGFDKLDAALRDPKISIAEKVKALESNEACGPLMKKMTEVFTKLQENFGNAVSENMRQDLMLQVYNTIINHIKTQHDVDWTPETLNSIGLTLELSPNLFSSMAALIGGLISINIKGKTYVVPIAPQGLPQVNEGYLTEKMLNELRKNYAEVKGISAKDIKINPGRLSSEGLLVRVPTPDGGFEYRATSTQETFATANLERKDNTYESLAGAFNSAYIKFNRDSDPSSFTMDVRDYGNTKLGKTNLVVNVDPKLKPYVDVVGLKGNKYKIRFKEGFKQFGKFLISRQDIISPMQNEGTPRLTKIMLKADTTFDSALEEMNDYTGLYKYHGHNVTEKGSQSADNNLFASDTEYQAYLAKSPNKYLKLDESDLTEAEKQEASEAKEAIREHRQLWGIDTVEKTQMRTHDEIDNIVGDFLNFIRKNKTNPEYKEAYNILMNDKFGNQTQSDTIMKVLQKYTKDTGKPALNELELQYAKNVFSIKTFTDISKYIEKKDLKKIQSILKKRVKFFGKIADKLFANTSEGQDPNTRKEMVSFIEKRMSEKVDSLTLDDLNNREHIDRDSLGQFLGSMAGRLMDKKQGRLADLDTYGSIEPNMGENSRTFEAFGIKSLSIHDKGAEGKVARAIIEIEYPHQPNLEGKNFLNQPLSVQVGVNAVKFFTPKEIAALNKIKKGEKNYTPEMTTVFNKFRELVNTVRHLQMNPDTKGVESHPNYIVIPNLGPNFKNAMMVIKPIGVKDFFFEKCGNHSWGVDGSVNIYETDQPDVPVFAGTKVDSRISMNSSTEVSYYTISLAGAGEQRVRPKDTEKDFGNAEHEDVVDTTKDGEPAAPAPGTKTAQGNSASASPTVGRGTNREGYSPNVNQRPTGESYTTPTGSQAAPAGSVDSPALPPQ